MKIKSVEDCKLCKHYKGMHNIETVLCGKTGCNSLVFVQPSFYNEGFENAALVIRCLTE
jgi:hypothetical protein